MSFIKSFKSPTVAALGLILLAMLSACAPSQSARQQQQEQIRNDNKKTKKEFSTVAGLYKGTMTSESGDVFVAELRIWVTVVSVVNAGSSTPTEIPTLAGSLTWKATPRMDDIETFGAGSFDPSTGETLLYSSVTSSNPSGQVPLASLAARMVYSGGHLTGDFCSTQCNSLDLKRVAVAPVKAKTPKTTSSTNNQKASK